MALFCPPNLGRGRERGEKGRVFNSEKMAILWSGIWVNVTATAPDIEMRGNNNLSNHHELFLTTHLLSSFHEIRFRGRDDSLDHQNTFINTVIHRARLRQTEFVHLKIVSHSSFLQFPHKFKRIMSVGVVIIQYHSRPLWLVLDRVNAEALSSWSYPDSPQIYIH
jgi:hypothetical protein